MSPQQKDAIYHEIYDVFAYRPLSSMSPLPKNAVHHEIHDVVAYRI